MNHYRIQNSKGDRLADVQFDSFEEVWQFIRSELTGRLGLTEDDYADICVFNDGGAKMTREFRIYDWAGNDKSGYYGMFKTEEDAWERLREEFPDDSEDSNESKLGEFHVEETRGIFE